jgi:hypothetical protein
MVHTGEYRNFCVCFIELQLSECFHAHDFGQHSIDVKSKAQQITLKTNIIKVKI